MLKRELPNYSFDSMSRVLFTMFTISAPVKNNTISAPVKNKESALQMDWYK